MYLIFVLVLGRLLDTLFDLVCRQNMCSFMQPIFCINHSGNQLLIENRSCLLSKKTIILIRLQRHRKRQNILSGFSIKKPPSKQLGINENAENENENDFKSQNSDC